MAQLITLIITVLITFVEFQLKTADLNILLRVFAVLSYFIILVMLYLPTVSMLTFIIIIPYIWVGLRYVMLANLRDFTLTLQIWL